MFLISVVIVVGLPETPAAELGVLVNASLARMKLRLHREPEAPQLVLVQLVVQQTMVNLEILKTELFVLATRNSASLLVLRTGAAGDRGRRGRHGRRRREKRR